MSMPSCEITDGIRQLILPQSECILLELKLNVTKYGKSWSFIGDFLFDFGSKNISADKMYKSVTVTAEQYDFVELLMSRPSWKDCYEL